MSVRKTDYVLVGVKLTFLTDREDFDPYEENVYDSSISKELVSISDGMDGRYTFIGKVLQKASEEDGGSLETIDCVRGFLDNYENTKKLFWKHPVFKEFAGQEMSIFVFSHFT